MKQIRKIFVIALSVIMAATVFAACGGSKEDKGNVFTPPSPYGEITSLHEISCYDTDKDLLKNGKTEYKILIPASPASDENLAASELTSLFRESTSVDLEIVRESDATPTGKYISIGRTKLLENSSLAVDKAEVGNDGYVIRTMGDNVFICGGGDKGSLYGTYEFLAQTLGFETFSADCYSLDKNVSGIKLKDYNVKERPDFAKRVEGYKFVRDDKTYLNRMRQQSYIDTWIYVIGDTPREVHNSLQYLPPSKWKGSNPDWYASGQQQLCYTAHGNAEEREKMITEVARVMIEYLKQFPDRDIITFTQEDRTFWCTCDACAAENQKYGTDSAAVIKFTNEVNRKVRTWMTTEEGRPYARDLSILFFAYYSTVAAPVTKTADGYKPIDETVKCDDGVSVFYAPIEMDYTSSINASVNDEYRDNLLAWSAISDKIFVWFYSTNFKANYLIPYDNFATMQELYKFAKSVNVEMLYDQSQASQAGGATAFYIFKEYLTAKLEWNVSLDVDELTDRFFKNYFGEASVPMRKMYDEIRVRTAIAKADGLYGNSKSSIYQEMATAEIWPQSLLERWMNYTAEALEAIEPIKEKSASRYSSLRKHIIAERIFPTYMLIDKYDAQYSEAEVNTMKTRFVSDVQEIGLTWFSEKGTMADYIKKLK